MATVSVGRLSQILTVVLIASSMDVQVVSAFCRCFGDGLECYECQCDADSDCRERETLLRDCIDKETLGCEKHQPSEDCTEMGGNTCGKSSQQGCNYEDCFDNLMTRFSCEDMDFCDDKKAVPIIVIVIPTVCVTLVILVVICTVMLALYRKFKIKVIRETRKSSGCADINTDYNMTTAMANRQSQEDPLYSVLDTQDPSGYTEPPELPPSRVPYYQEIESDGVGKTKIPYEVPLQHPGNKQDNNDTKNEGVDPYQEPIDALRKEDPSLKLGDAQEQGEKETEMDTN